MADNFTERENYILSNSVNIGWFLEAIDKNNPLHPEEGAAHTESYELDGQNILVPRVRIKDGKAVLNKENALEEALKRGDYIVVPEGEDPDQYSKDLSKLIGKFRGFDRGGLATQTEEVFNTDAEGRRRRKDRPEPEQKFVHPLETVPFFQRPKGSSTNDIQVGQDDAGNPVFQGMLGTYIVRVNPDQRTTRQKITDAIPTVKESVSEYLKDPKLPTREQMGQFARDATIGAVENLGETMFTPKGTLGDVFSLAAGAGAASVPFDVPKGALRIFGGVGAEGAAKDRNLKKAIKLLKKSGVNPTNTQESYFTNKNIWEQTGWFVDPSDGQWRFEIDDAKSSIDAEKFREKSVVTFDEFKDESVNPKLKLPLKDLFKHENLYKRYPDLKDKTITLYSEPESRVRGKVIDGDQILINAGHSDFNDITDIRSTLLHEIQHVIQNKEVGFAPGASLAAVDPKLIEGRSKELADLKTPLKVKAAALNKQLDNPKLSDQRKLEIVQELQKVQGDIIRLDAEDLGSEFEFYRGASGEIEARLVQRREGGSDKFPVQDRIEMIKEEKEKRKPAGSFNYSRKLDPYLYKRESRQEPESPNFLRGVKKKLGLSESREDLKDYGYRTDNPATKGYDNGKEWLKNKQKTAEDKAKKYSGDSATGKLLSGAITGYMGQDFKKPLFLNTEMLSKLKGANDESRYAGESRYDALRKRVDERGFDPEQKYDSEDKFGNAIVIGVNHKGKAFIIEGNTRVAVAKDLNVPSIRAEVKYYNGAEEVDGPYSPQNILQYAENLKDFNKGGTVMNRQMEMAFMKEGGLKDDGMKVDPVSGNEIPPGSMAKEVRDDIPAQLSEGEYVVPADVVQFYGVKHFEDLRNKAKGGLKQMENDGRIGGEPVYANTGTMVQGGFSGPSVAPAQPGVAQIPMPLQNPAPFNPMQTPLQGNPGAGFVYQTPGQQAYNQPTRYYGSFSNAPQSITQPPNTPVPVVGQPVTPPVDTPESCAARGMVFNPETGMCVLPDPVQTPQPTGGDDKDRPDFPQGDPNAWMDKYDYENVDNLLEQSSGALDPATGLAGFVGKVLGGGVLGLFAKGSNAAQVAANINVLSSIPESSLTASQKESLAGLKTKYENYVTSNNLDIFGTELINGDQLAIDIITNPKNRGKGLFLTADSVDPFGNKIFKGGEKDPKFIKVMEDVASPGYTYVPGDDDNLGYYKADSDTKLAPDTSLRPPTRPTNVTPAPAPVTNNNNNNNDDGRDAHREAHKAFVEKQQKMSEAKSKVEEAAKKDPSAGIYTGGGPSGGFNKGGLMRKKKK